MFCHFHSNRSMRLKGLGLLALLAVASVRIHAEEPKPWPFKDGDRVVLVGDTLIERDQRYGYLETELTLANPDLNLTFRNLGWSGDTVRGLSRAGFDPPEAGFRELVKQVQAAKPTVLIVGYGMADSFDGEAGLSRFEEGMNAFLDAVSATKARLIFLSPIPHENLGPPLPDPAEHNRSLDLYAEAIRKIAGQRGGRYIELLDWFREEGRPKATDDGINLNEGGYERLGLAVRFRLGQPGYSPSSLEIDAGGKVVRADKQKVSGVKRTTNGLRFVAQSGALPPPMLPAEPGAKPASGWGLARGTPDLRFPGLAPGTYTLTIDGRAVVKATAADWEKGINFWPEPERDQVERLRRTINEKNLLFFYRWRPQNQTYLFGFRKHEQGNNAIEVPQFDPLVEAKEKEIAALRKPLPHVYELVKESEVSR